MLAPRTILRSSWCFIVACATALSAWAQPDEEDPARDPLQESAAPNWPFDRVPSATETDLIVLKKGRVEAARVRVSTLNSKLGAGGHVNMYDVRDAYEQLFEAELELAETARDRAEIARRWFAACWEYAEKKMAGYEAGRPDSPSDVVAGAIADRLKAQAAYIKACKEAKIKPFTGEDVRKGERFNDAEPRPLPEFDPPPLPKPDEGPGQSRPASQRKVRSTFD